MVARGGFGFGGALRASQGDVAQLQGQNIDWPNKVLSFFRQKTGTPVMLHLGEEALGHQSKAVHRAYVKRALVKIPSLEEYEKRNEPHAEVQA